MVVGRGIPLATLDEQPELDLAIDGADEVRRAMPHQLLFAAPLLHNTVGMRVFTD